MVLGVLRLFSHPMGFIYDGRVFRAKVRWKAWKIWNLFSLLKKIGNTRCRGLEEGALLNG
jgi:hypothetical protein